MVDSENLVNVAKDFEVDEKDDLELATAYPDCAEKFLRAIVYIAKL